MPLYPARALERAMKISEVITWAISGKINWIQAAEILGMSDRQLRHPPGSLVLNPQRVRLVPTRR